MGFLATERVGEVSTGKVIFDEFLNSRVRVDSIAPQCSARA